MVTYQNKLIYLFNTSCQQGFHSVRNLVCHIEDYQTDLSGTMSPEQNKDHTGCDTMEDVQLQNALAEGNIDNSKRRMPSHI
jgi:hypothetical protein